MIDEMAGTGQETGLQVAAYLHGEPVLIAHAGLADRRTGRPVQEHTLFHAWSAGKGLIATVVHVLAERGLLDYDTSVAEYWPQFAAHGKQNITLAHVLAHTAGLPLTPAGLTPDDLTDWEEVCERIAGQPPIWEPGTATGYHALTFGYILGEVIRRVMGRPPGQVLREEVAIPLGIADDLLFGVPADALPRVARMEDGSWTAAIDARPDDSPFFQVAPRPLQARAELGNRPGYLTADVPCTATVTAVALARMYAALIGEVGGTRLITPERLSLITTVVTADTDRFLGVAIRKGLGYFLGLPEMGPRPEAFGCKGSGGSIGFADPARGFAFGLVHNRLAAPPDDAAVQIATAVRSALGL
ncbi:serine hydrolase domain-containing protein [Streptosporangium roseum]|uniref:serine hydrolase domain-containing protein n=1 Tax=Streptosporangium roseum TaxID=2001 RepID=UPI0018CC1E65|nr:serine hydrolase domain-containing protein [Streptosporangium roseum]